jgi:hypothetical protein
MIIQDIIPPRTKASREIHQSIPTIIHQTFENNDLPPLMHDAVMTWVNLNPEYEYRFSNSVARRVFLKDNFEPKILMAYDTLQSGAFKADLWRYCQLYVNGGVYSDVHQVCRRPLSEFLLPEDRFVSARAGNLPFAMACGFICATPQHPFLRQAIDRAVDIILSKRNVDGYVAVGPWNLGVSVNACLGRPEKSSFAFGETHANGFRLRLVRKCRSENGGPPYLEDEDGRVILYTEYDGYHEDLAQLGIDHWSIHRPKTSVVRRVARRVKSVLKGKMNES